MGWAWAVAGARAAVLHAEDFADGANGWISSGRLTMSATQGTLQGTFAAQGFPMPESGSFVATNTSSGGAFVGDYPAAGLQLVGFSFMARDVLPSAALIRWTGPTSSFFRSFASAITQTGVWYRVAFSLRSKEAGSWIGGTAEAFGEGLTDVRSLEIQLTRTGMAAQRYELDDVFVDALPAGACTHATNGTQVLWSSLRPNTAYVVEAAATPDMTWEEAGAFTATNTLQVWPDPTANATTTRVYRLLFLEVQ